MLGRLHEFGTPSVGIRFPAIPSGTTNAGGYYNTRLFAAAKRRRADICRSPITLTCYNMLIVEPERATTRRLLLFPPTKIEKSYCVEFVRAPLLDNAFTGAFLPVPFSGAYFACSVIALWIGEDTTLMDYDG
jgi:hypothetical protein